MTIMNWASFQTLFTRTVPPKTENKVAVHRGIQYYQCFKIERMIEQIMSFINFVIFDEYYSKACIERLEHDLKLLASKEHVTIIFNFVYHGMGLA
mmetsp:Transcript_50215/g.92858  ORF Transcript_50215/g.92858 Transcript_50215/m.92858 type:complete len:95 (-) Transcript_50215:302-586(-)